MQFNICFRIGNRFLFLLYPPSAKPEAYISGAEVGMGARIAFDNAGYVYLTLGNMLANYAGAQDLDKPYGKILRLHDDGRIPYDNPRPQVKSEPDVYAVRVPL